MDITNVSALQGISLSNSSGTLKTTSNGQSINFPKGDGVLEKNLEKALMDSALDDRIPNKSSLNKMGFKTSGMKDMNGGTWYKNENGDNIRIAGFHGDMISGPEDSTTVMFRSADGNFKHEVVYDPEGNPLKGVLVVENEDGSMEQYNYDYDIDGNKHVTSYQKAVRD